MESLPNLNWDLFELPMRPSRDIPFLEDVPALDSSWDQTETSLVDLEVCREKLIGLG